MRRGVRPSVAPAAEPRRRTTTDAGRCPEVQGVQHHLSPRGPLRLRALLRPARGRLQDAQLDAPTSCKRRIQAGPHTLWRYADFLPLEGPARSALPTGWTPLVRAHRLAERLGLREVWIKNETANPTHSFKDRVVSVALARALELGFDTLACASTGNLAGAVAAHAAAAGLPAYVFVPADLEPEKILSAGAYGAHDHRRGGELRRRQPALHRDLGRARGLGLRERQRAPLLRGGLEDAGVRDRRAARLGDARSRRRPGRLRARSSPRSRAASRT